MKQFPTDLVPAFLLVCAVAVAIVPRGAAADPAPPATRTVDAKDVLHGVTVPDPYRWLEDVKAPEVQAWMKAPAITPMLRSEYLASEPPMNMGKKAPMMKEMLASPVCGAR